MTRYELLSISGGYGIFAVGHYGTDNCLGFYPFRSMAVRALVELEASA